MRGRIRQALKGRSLKWLAERSQISETKLCEYMLGEEFPDPVIRKIAKALEVDFKWLVKGETYGKGHN